MEWHWLYLPTLGQAQCPGVVNQYKTDSIIFVYFSMYYFCLIVVFCSNLDCFDGVRNRKMSDSEDVENLRGVRRCKRIWSKYNLWKI